MNTETCERWEVAGGIEWPAADVSFAYEAPDVVAARIGFANVMRGSNHDLVLRFSGVVALRHESESSCVCVALIGSPSTTLAIRSHPRAASREHFVLITMNDLLHILALPNVETSWTKPVA